MTWRSEGGGYLAAERRWFGERVSDVMRWFFLATLAILNYGGALADGGAEATVNALLVGWAAVSVAVTVALARRAPGRLFPLVTTALDVVAAAALLEVTHGFASPYFLALFVTIIAASVRFGLAGSLVTAVVVSVLYLGVGGISAGAGVAPGSDVLGRVGLFLVVAVTTGLTSSTVVRQREQAVIQAAEFEGLFEMATAMASSLNVRDVFAIILEQASAITGADRGLLLRVSPSGILVAAGDPSGINIDVNALLEVAESGNPAVADGGRVLRLPIRSGDTGSFVLRLESAVPFGDRARFRAEKLAAVAATAIDNAFRYGARAEEATVDALTGAWNRRGFDHRLAEEVSRASRAGSPFSVVLIDVDRFKTINDTLGHATGDKVLSAIARIAQTTVRSHDVVGRLGGDEFAILLPESDAAAARGLARRLVAGVERAGLDAGDGNHVTISIGIGAYPANGFDAAAVLAAADDALYAVKRAGRDGIGVAAPRKPRAIRGAVTSVAS